MDAISEVLIAILIILMSGIIMVLILLFKRAEYVFIFTTERTLKGRWLLFKNKVKNGKLKIGDGEYIIAKTKPFLLNHKFLGHIPAYFFTENNPEPMDLSKQFPRSKLTASAIKKMAKMDAVEKIMSPDDKKVYDILVYLLIGVFVGAGLVFTLLFMGIIDVPVGICLSNPAVIEALNNATMPGVVS